MKSGACNLAGIVHRKRIFEVPTGAVGHTRTGIQLVETPLDPQNSGGNSFRDGLKQRRITGLPWNGRTAIELFAASSAPTIQPMLFIPKGVPLVPRLWKIPLLLKSVPVLLPGGSASVIPTAWPESFM